MLGSKNKRQAKMQHQQDDKGNPQAVMNPERPALGQPAQGYGFNHPELGDTKTGNKKDNGQRQQ